jgi:hypothetical protein
MPRCTASAVSFLCYAIRGTALLMLTCLCSTFAAQANAQQDGTPELEPRDFHNAKGDVITNGLLVSSDGNKVAVTSVNGQIEIRLSELAVEDKEWVREELKRRKLEKEALDVKNELHLADGSGKSHIVFKALRKLRPYGPSAHHSGVLLVDMLKRDYLDSKTRQEVLLTYIATTPLSSAQSDEVLKYIAQEWTMCGPLVSADPTGFLTTYSRFGDSAEDYLVGVAFTGELKPKPGQRPPAKPKNSDLADATLLANQAAAARALGELKSERALEFILEVAAVIEKQDASEKKTEAEKLCLEAIAANGISNDAVDELLNRWKERLPDQVDRARAKLNKSSGK